MSNGQRSTTFDLSAALSRLGVKGGRFPVLADGPLQPVLVAGDISNTTAPEAIEARGSAECFGEWPDRAVPVYYFFSQAEGGCVLESLSLAALAIGESTPNHPPLAPGTSAFGHDRVGVFPGGWFLSIVTGAPVDVFTKTDTTVLPFIAGAYTIPSPGANGRGGGPYPALDIGGVATQSRVWAIPGQRSQPTTPAYTAVPAGNAYWDPFAWVGSDGAWDAMLPPVAALQTNVRLFIPPGSGLLIVGDQWRQTIGTPDATTPQCCLSLVWREIPVPTGLP